MDFFIYVQGSGRVADFFTRWLSYLKDDVNDGKEKGQKPVVTDVYELYQVKKTRKLVLPPPANQKTHQPVTTVVNTAR
jgi:hypothetical protein